MGQDRLNNALDMTACARRGSGRAAGPLKPRAGMRLLDRGVTNSR
jgi:hypothetical protein